jgi:hypothetical protein
MFLSLSLFLFVVIYSLKNIKVEEINKCFFFLLFSIMICLGKKLERRLGFYYDFDN